jgi:hypothetical protein
MPNSRRKAASSRKRKGWGCFTLIGLAIVAQLHSCISDFFTPPPSPTPRTIQGAITVGVSSRAWHPSNDPLTWVNDFRNYQCPARTEDSVSIRDGEGNVLIEVPLSPGIAEITGTKPIVVSCYYYFTTVVPELEEYDIEGLGRFSLRDLDYRDWKLYRKPLTESVLTRFSR